MLGLKVSVMIIRAMILIGKADVMINVIGIEAMMVNVTVMNVIGTVVVMVIGIKTAVISKAMVMIVINKTMTMTVIRNIVKRALAKKTLKMLTIT